MTPDEIDRLSELERENARLRAALELAESALANSYNVVDWPANGRSEQDVALAAVRAALAGSGEK
jgi:5,10-methylenetetrahydrofolate reductase